MSENLHAMDDDTLRRYAEWLGIPAATLRGLREKRLVAVPAEPITDLLQRWRDWTPYQQPVMGTPKAIREHEARGREAGVRLMHEAARLCYEIAAAQEPPR